MIPDPYTQAGPYARVDLPDGQSLDVLVTARTRATDGTWWYELQIVLPSRLTDSDGRTRVEPAPVTFAAPAGMVTPIPDEDYSAVPTESERAGRRFEVEHVRMATGPRYLLHLATCWVRGERQKITTAEAREYSRHDDTAACDICKPGRVLGG